MVFVADAHGDYIVHLCPDELRLIPLLLPVAATAVIYARSAWVCFCAACRRFAR